MPVLQIKPIVLQLHHTDYAFKLYNQAHPDKPMTPKFSDFYQPSEQQKQGKLPFLGGSEFPLGYAPFCFHWGANIPA